MPKDITSPFTPGRPVPVEFFVGRQVEINRLRRKVSQAVDGQLQIGFVIGERGIGKSSLASFVRFLCERDLNVLGLHTFLGGVTTLEEMVRRIFDRLLNEAVGTTWHEKVKGLFGQHISEVGLFGISLAFRAPEKDLRRLAHDFAPALRNLVDKIKEDKKGILLILDDINGLASSVDFANWLKSLVDEISTSAKPLPLCLLLVGLEDRRESLISSQPSLARVFDLTEIRSWSEQETRQFFENAFSKVAVEVAPDALDVLVRYAGGLPVLAHEIGDAAFSVASDAHIKAKDAVDAVFAAADIVGRKHLEPQVFKSIRSATYRDILRKLAVRPVLQDFTRAQIKERLTSKETKALDNFLRKMVHLGVIASDPEKGPGSYKFSSRLHYLYFYLEARRAQRAKG